MPGGQITGLFPNRNAKKQATPIAGQPLLLWLRAAINRRTIEEKPQITIP